MSGIQTVITDALIAIPLKDVGQVKHVTKKVNMQVVFECLTSKRIPDSQSVIVVHLANFLAI